MANLDIDRTRRVAELIKREIAYILAREVNDRRINKLSVTHVDISKDLKNARVFVSSMMSDVEPELIEQQLFQASKFIRQQLSQKLKLRVTPRLSFKYDETIDRAMHLEQLMQSLHKSDSGTFAERESKDKDKDKD